MIGQIICARLGPSNVLPPTKSPGEQSVKEVTKETARREVEKDKVKRNSPIGWQ